MERFHIWTIGCQMNKADSDRLSSALLQLGLEEASRPDDADVIVLNSCVVRQGAEDKVVSALGRVKPLRTGQPDRVVALMGCMVGPRHEELASRFPWVDVFLPPQQYKPLLDIVGERMGLDWEGCVGSLVPVCASVSCYVPIIKGCDLMCTFCIIPYRRGRQVSTPPDDVVGEVELLVSRGAKEVILLGQTVDAYGYDLPGKPDLGDLLRRLDGIEGLERIRFLTSHPMFMGESIIRAVVELEKVCEHINLPVQAGDDEVLARMHRRYTRDEYRTLVDRIRCSVPGVALSTDIIVGFPGETEAQYQRSLDLIEELRFDKVHTAAYSQRPGTIAFRQLQDDVTAEEKDRRLKEMDQRQEHLLTQKNSQLLGKVTEVLVEGRHKGRWQGRTRTDKIVFFDDPRDRLGELVNVEITKTSPWSLQGSPMDSVAEAGQGWVSDGH